MTEDEIRKTLLVEAHRIVASSASDAVSKIGAPLRRVRASVDEAPATHVDPKLAAAIPEGVAKITLTYPPENVLSDDEDAALASMKLNPAERCGLEKLVAEACAATMFQFFCLMDAVADPEAAKVRDWYGARFAAHPEDSHYEMLHDAFYDMYWEYKAALESERDRR